MMDQAIEYYERALTLSTNDENLHYNIARAYFAKGNFAKAVDHIIAALKLNRTMPESKKFLKYLAGKKLLDQGMQASIVKELNESIEKLIE
jgi:tetratricopeptide (TPR) repeat protein